MTHLVIVPVILLSHRLAVGNLLVMDGGWNRFIALDWYDRPYVPGGWSEYPFFPLYPGLAGGLMRIGLPDTVALCGVSWLAALAALAGVYRLAVRHLGTSRAAWAVWFVALAPGAIGMHLAYADGTFLAGLVWAVVLVEERRWRWAGVALLAVVASRPNGFLMLLPLALLWWRGDEQPVATDRPERPVRSIASLAWLVAPSLVFLAGWMLYLRWATHDAFVFWHAKSAWSELTITEFLDEPIHHPLGAFHLAALAFLVVPYLLAVRRQPWPWAVLAALLVLPSAALGIEGVARYGVLAFPFALGATDVLVRRPKALAVAYLAVSGAAFVFLAHQVVSASWVP